MHSEARGASEGVGPDDSGLAEPAAESGRRAQGGFVGDAAPAVHAGASGIVHTNPLKYRPDIDGLRAIAVLSVVVYHAFPQLLGGGFVGVDIFFVISGYLISTIIFSQLSEGRFSFSAFYSRRIRRIFPAVIVVLMTCLGLGWTGMLPDAFEQLGKHVAAGMGFVSNLVLWSESGYFDAEAHSKPLMHLWSLGIEEQFYIFWPLLAAVAAWRRNGLFLLATGTIAASFVFNIYWTGVDPTASFYSPLSRAWELGVGGLLAWLVLDGRLKALASSPVACNVLALLGIFLIAIAVVFISAEMAFPGWWAVLPVAGSALLMASGSGAWLNRTVLSSRAAVWIGLISYPLYLWHWPALFVAREITQDTPGAAKLIAAIVISIALSALTYYLIERRVRHRKGPVALALLSLGMIVAAAGAAVWQQNGVPQRSYVTQSNLTPAVNAQFTGPHWQYTSNETCMERYPFPAAEEANHWFCVMSSGRPPTMILLGNSFANQLYPGFAKNPELAHHSVLSIGTCELAGPLENFDVPPNNPCYGTRTRVQQEFLRDLIEREPTLRFAVLSGTRLRPDQDYIDRLGAWIDLLESRGIRVIVTNPHLRIGFHPRECFRGSSGVPPRDCTIPAEAREAADRALAFIREGLASTHPNVMYFDQNQMYCEGGTCSSVHHGMPLQRDASGHMSEYGSILLQDYFTSWAREHLPQILDPAYLDTPADPGTAQSTQRRR